MIKITRPIVCFMFFIMFVTLYNQTYNEKSLTYKNIVALPVNYSPLEFGCKAHRSGATCFIMNDLFVFKQLPIIPLEVFKDIPGFEELYQASNYGYIKSLKKIRNTGRTGTTLRTYPEKILKPTTSSSRGYPLVTLMNFGITKYITVHRLIALTFLPNPHNLPCINHKDNNKLNSTAWNVEWCTHSQNSQHAFDIGAQPGAYKTGADNHKSIRAKNLITNEIYDCLRDAYKSVGYKKTYENFLKRIHGIPSNDTHCEILTETT